jgi:hypothetical protein
MTRWDDKSEKHLLRLETILLEPGDAKFSKFWRGRVPCDEKVLKVELSSRQRCS